MQNFVRDGLEKLEILKILIKTKIVVTDAMTRVDNNETGTVINAVEQESSFLESERVARQVEKIVTHEQRQVEKIVTHAHRVGSVLWRHQSHVAKHDLTCVDLTWRSNSILFNTTCTLNLIALVTVDLSVKPES